MSFDSTQGATASTGSLIPSVSSGPIPLPDYQHETVRHLLLGPLVGVQLTIQELHKRHYAEPNDWSKPMPTGRPNEVIAILTKRVILQPADPDSEQ